MWTFGILNNLELNSPRIVYELIRYVLEDTSWVSGGSLPYPGERLATKAPATSVLMSGS